MLLTLTSESSTLEESSLYSSRNSNRLSQPWLFGVSSTLESKYWFAWLTWVPLPLWCLPHSKILPPSADCAKTAHDVLFLVSCYLQRYQKIGDIFANPMTPQGVAKYWISYSLYIICLEYFILFFTYSMYWSFFIIFFMRLFSFLICVFCFSGFITYSHHVTCLVLFSAPQQCYSFYWNVEVQVYILSVFWFMSNIFLYCTDGIFCILLITILVIHFKSLLVIRLLLSLKCVLPQWFSSMFLTLCEFY